MRIALVSPLIESVPPKLYGGTERVVYYLAEELVKKGHNVTVFASSDSETSANLVGICPALRLAKKEDALMIYYTLLMEKVLQKAEEFEIIHFNLEYFHLPIAKRLKTKVLTTFHGRLDIPDYPPLFKEFKDLPFVSISNAQRKPLSFLNWQATVYHGLPKDLFRANYNKGKYLAFVGRSSPLKRPDLAIEIAIRAGLPIKLTLKIGKQDEAYFEEKVKPLLKHPLVEFIGELTDKRKEELLGNALALVFPIDWPEPFGLVMIEAMACGTPVLARKLGSVPEVMKEGVSGFIFDTIDEAVKKVEKIEQIDRRGVRAYFEERFTSERMAKDYLKVYSNLLS